MSQLWKVTEAALPLGLVLIGVLGSSAQSSNGAARFIRRYLHNVAVLGDYLYIDGGEISRYINDEGDMDEYRVLVEFNDTLSLPLTESWTNATVPITTVPKAAPVLDMEALWADAETDSLYAWGGQGPFGNVSESKDLWRFRVSSTSSHEEIKEWVKQPAANMDVFLRLVRVKDAASTTCRDAGYSLGGIGTVFTDPEHFEDSDIGVPVSGILVYNMTSRTWANESTTPLSADATQTDEGGLNAFGTFIGGSLVCLPGIGTRMREGERGGNDKEEEQRQGLLLALGGEIATLEDGYDLFHPNFIGFDSVSVWDIATKKWHSQATTGDVPSPRSRFCAVSASSSAGARNKDEKREENIASYEVFIFGGFDQTAKKGFDSVYVLSVPGFVWFKADSTGGGGGPRKYHACTLAGPGGDSSRQMIVVGGINGELDFRPRFADKDPWANGIGIFDISELSWKDGFDAQAAPYERPRLVEEWYDAGNQDSVNWSSGSVRELFLPKDAASSSGGPVSGNGSLIPSTGQESGSLNIGAVIGGAVGGVAVVVALVFFVWWYRRRSQRHREVSVQELPEESRVELPEESLVELSAEFPAQLPQTMAGQEAPPTHNTAKELGGTAQNAGCVTYGGANELDGSNTVMLGVPR